jgi:hypothetical protein
MARGHVVRGCEGWVVGAVVNPGVSAAFPGSTGVANAHSSARRPPAATSAGMRADGPRRTPASEAARSPASVSAPRPAQVRTADGETSALLAASSPPTPSTVSRIAKLRVMRVSLRVPSDGPLSRSGATAKATPMAILTAAKVPTTSLELTLTITLNVARPRVTLAPCACLRSQRSALPATSAAEPAIGRRESGARFSARFGMVRRQ